MPLVLNRCGMRKLYLEHGPTARCLALDLIGAQSTAPEHAAAHSSYENVQSLGHARGEKTGEINRSAAFLPLCLTVRRLARGDMALLDKHIPLRLHRLRAMCDGDHFYFCFSTQSKVRLVGAYVPHGQSLSVW